MRPDRPSFRQVGREKRGKLRSGPLTGQRTGAPTAAASIPSKFETTLCPNTGARKGFGSCAHRFTEVENDLPGPGSYESARAAVRDDRVYSKKGLGVGFVSKTQRKSLVPRNYTPAPGAYEDPRSFSRELRSRYAAGGGTSSFRPPSQRPVEAPDALEARQSAIRMHERLKAEARVAAVAKAEARQQMGFAQRRAAPPQPTSRQSTPAPGQYEPRRLPEGGHLASSGLPGPGQYQTDPPALQRALPAERRDTALISSPAFMSNSARIGGQAPAPGAGPSEAATGAAPAAVVRTYLVSNGTEWLMEWGHAKFAAFQRNYLTVYALMIAGDWLQAKPGPYVYRLYDYYGLAL
ncbi:hypothetical protein EMIHUDRAFT_218476 [Emiliania huxleyi CCMP1516]|uniref:Uncharacterized protein n=2 Tax=Emiliania huxleyi TaxID=2903 RepID=A0A0D3I8C7_EMIH1|nr:hypothetical protein EMIHUDRAFT_218476 [Emiliania huxleyi CCMP1516]EOD07512.1 hypothetical protein EMIHUDRAFT_218476 [Emiliania huxleyi CCMP1516]|eukprot:XP_005759941.1 hypothetical protein EMIHUDRAFT_218476 [Emiliania huxleyi CCMP1516]